MAFSIEQILEELYEERWLIVYAFCYMVIVSTDKGIAEVPGMSLKQFVIFR